MKNLPPANQIPYFIKYFVILASAVLTCYVLVISKPILNSLLPACIFALLLRPFGTRMERLKIPRALSTVLSILLVLIVFAGLSFFFSSQVGSITSNMDSLVNTFTGLFDKLQQWTTHQFGIEPQEQIAYIKGSLTALLKNSSTFFSSTLSATAGFFTAFFPFPLSVIFLPLLSNIFIVVFISAVSQRKSQTCHGNSKPH